MGGNGGHGDSADEPRAFRKATHSGFADLWAKLSAEPYDGHLRTFVDHDAGVTLDRYVIVGASGTQVIDNWLQHFDESSLSEELVAAGFAVEALYGEEKAREIASQMLTTVA